jgi:hypothetical protein
MALERFPARCRSIVVISSLALMPRAAAISRRASQKAFSTETLVLWPAITTERFRISAASGERVDVAFALLRLVGLHRFHGAPTVAWNLGTIGENAPVPRPHLNTVLMKIPYRTAVEMDCFALMAGVPMQGTAVARAMRSRGFEWQAWRHSRIRRSSGSMRNSWLRWWSTTSFSGFRFCRCRISSRPHGSRRCRWRRPPSPGCLTFAGVSLPSSTCASCWEISRKCPGTARWV